MDTDRLQSIDTGLHKHVEATRSTNELIIQLFTMISTLKANNIAIYPPALVSPPPPVITTPRVSHTSQIKPGISNNFDSHRVQGHTFLTYCKPYMLLTTSDFPDDQVYIHWALSYFNSGHAATSH
jgi:hypothetical protein